VVTSLVRHVDVLPTVAELLGIPLNRSELRLAGVSLVPLLENPSADLGIDAAFSQRRPPDERRLRIGWDPGKKLSAQDASHKFILNPVPPHEFYDLQRDPNELRNLIHAPDPRKDRLEAWLVEKYDTLSRDHRSEDLSDEIDPQVLEDLKALGYF
jgi:arylsulfatase A-like enzyme